MTSAQAAPGAAAPAEPSAPPAPAAAAARPLAFPPLQGAERALGTLVLSLATFMTVLDTSIANVSIPAISGDLGVSPNQGTWVITSFAVANAIAVPLTGWLTQRFGQVRLFTASVLLFVLASWLCGLAPSIESLIAFRVLQGAVAGPLIPLSQTLLLASYPPAMAGIAMAMYGGALFFFPPVAIPDIWRDRALDFTETLEERLLAAACRYSFSPHIALVSAAPPGAGWRKLAQKYRKKWVHLPLSQFSDATIQQLRMVHVLNGREVRSYAAEFIRKA
jgi:MFS family permease